MFQPGRPGFDAVIGNPPWEEMTVERLAFYARYSPGIRALPAGERELAIADLEAARPDLPQRLQVEQDRFGQLRKYFADSEYESMPGDPDLYKFFCQHYRGLLQEWGRLGVVLPRSAFVTQGSTDFRRWLFTEMTTRRVDFLLNKGRWAFDSEPRYTVALVSAQHEVPFDSHEVELAGVADSLQAWNRQASGPGVRVSTRAFGPGLMTPLLRFEGRG